MTVGADPKARLRARILGSQVAPSKNTRVPGGSKQEYSGPGHGSGIGQKYSSIALTPEKNIRPPGGSGFGNTYFSTVHYNPVTK